MTAITVAALVALAATLLVLAASLSYAVFNLVTGRTGARGFSVVVPADDKAVSQAGPSNNSHGTLLSHKHIQAGRLLGLGAVGKTYRGRYRQIDVALKVLACKSTVAKVHDDVADLIRVRHPNLVLFLGLVSPKEGQVVLVSEFVPGGPLGEALRNPKLRLPWRQRLGMARQVAQALAYLHEARTSHQALNSLNVLLDEDMNARISDYGLARLRQSLQTRAAERPFWSAPEVIKSNKHGQAADVYAFGVVLWELVTRRTPFSHAAYPSPALLVRAIDSGVRPPVPDACPRPLRELIEACWHASPGRRPSAAELVERLFDPSLEAAPGLDREEEEQAAAAAAAAGTPLETVKVVKVLASTDASRWIIDPAELTVEKPIGAGSLGEVFRGQYRGKAVAIKMVRKNDEHRLEAFLHEVRTLSSLRHPNVLMLLGVCERDNAVLVVSEFLERGSLDAVYAAEHLDYDRTMRILMDVASGLAYLHMARPPVLHRDLKPQNVLVAADWSCRVADFSLSECTPVYTAPEALERGEFSPASDVFSLGTLVNELFARHAPFAGMNVHQATLAVVADGRRPDVPDFVPPRVKALVRRCWETDPALRPTAVEVLRELEGIRADGIPRQHLTEGDGAALYRKRNAVHAFRSRDVVTFFKPYGTISSKPGDVVVVGAGGDCYSCDAAIFERTYVAVGDPARPNTYRKATPVLALEMGGAFLLETLEGTEHGGAGDFLAQNPVQGEQWIISADKFGQMYERVPDADLPAVRAAVARQAEELASRNAPPPAVPVPAPPAAAPLPQPAPLQ